MSIITINKSINIINEIDCYYIVDKAIKSLSIKANAIVNNEGCKCWIKVINVINDMINNNITRSSKLISIGGGVTSDICGFIASIYMRGIEYISVPTTMLAQVDASIGSKNSINYHIKNVVGTFYKPQRILISLHFIRRITTNVYKDGMSEIVKISIVTNRYLFKYISNNIRKIYTRSYKLLHNIIIESIISKLYVVNVDCYEKNNRMLLNLGHTFGHAIERYMSYHISHGVCVWLGIYISLYLSLLIRICGYQQYICMITTLHTLVVYHTYHHCIDINKLIEYISHDKKISTYRCINYIFVRSIGYTYTRRIHIQTVYRFTLFLRKQLVL